MDGNKTFTKLRERYLNLLIYTLNNNIKKTLEHVAVDESLVQHYGLVIEENCFNKNRSDLAPYTKAITAARLNIESYTSKQQPYPMISNALQLPNETSSLDPVADEMTRPENDRTKRNSNPNPNCALADEVIVIDSSDTEDEIDALVTNDMKSQKANQNNNIPMGEILISVQTKPSSQ